MRASLVLVVALAGCITEGDATEPQPTRLYTGEFVQVDVSQLEASSSEGGDDTFSCEQAAAGFADDDLCSLMCSPTLLADQMRARGMSGRCFQFVCDPVDAAPVYVGACVP